MTKISDLYSDTIPFIENYFYHIYNKGNAKEKLFFNDSNYKYFLKKFDKYLSDYLDVYCYCLIPNHFHFLVKIKESNAKTSKSDRLNEIIIQQFSNFFNCYTKSVNVEQNRSGSLFKKHFKRRIILEEQYLGRIVLYIHLNPVHHKITDDYQNFRWSSYHRILSDKPSKLKRCEVLDIFGGRENYIKSHREESFNYQEISKYIFD